MPVTVFHVAFLYLITALAQLMLALLLYRSQFRSLLVYVNLLDRHVLDVCLQI